MNKALLVSALASHAAHAIKNCISPKEDVVRMARSGKIYEWFWLHEHREDFASELAALSEFATLARADLVAENERLKETREMILFLQAGANDEAVIKAAICSTEQAEERINLSVRACLNISTDQLRIAADARLDGLFKFKKRYEDQLTAARTALAAAETREEKLRATIDAVLSDAEECEDQNGWLANLVSCEAIHQLDEAFSQPRDDSALREMIAGAYDECAKVPQSIAEALADTHGHDDMGSLSFGRGDHAEEKLGRYNELMEIADALRALADKARHGN